MNISSAYATAKLKDLVDILQAGGTPSKKDPLNYKNGTIPFVKIADMTSTNRYLTATQEYISEVGLKTSSAWLVPTNTILYSMYASYGIPVITKIELATNQAIIAIRPTKELDLNYLFHYLYYIKPIIGSDTKGTTQKNLNAKIVGNIEVPIPDKFSKQQEIVDKIEELFSVVESVAESLTYVKKATTNLGNKLLFDSFTGKLTGDWRESNSVKETGIELVKKYTRSLIADSTLPSTWAKVRVGDVFGVYVGSTPSRKEKSYWGGDIPWVSSGEVSFCRIKETKETITQLGYDNSSTKIHPVGTVLLGMIGEGKTRGQVAILDIEATHNQNSAAIRVSETDVLPEYVYYFFQSEYQKTRQIGSGNNQKALNKTRVSEIEIPIPPVEEQQVIVKLLGAYFSNLEAIKKDLALSKEVKIQSLRQSILKQAFEGKLV